MAPKSGAKATAKSGAKATAKSGAKAKAKSGAKVIGKFAKSTKVKNQQQRSQEALRTLKKLEKGGRPYPMLAYKQTKWGSDERVAFVEKLYLDSDASFLHAGEKG